MPFLDPTPPSSTACQELDTAHHGCALRPDLCLKYRKVTDTEEPEMQQLEGGVCEGRSTQSSKPRAAALLSVGNPDHWDLRGELSP